jgi:hypothetical protein
MGGHFFLSPILGIPKFLQGIPGTLRKKLGIWHLAENLQNNCNSRNWDSTIPITPNFSWLRIIGKNQEKSGPNYSR